MHTARSLSILGAVFAAVALCLAMISPASAATSHTSRPLSPATAQGVGVGTWVDSAQTLYQCPSGVCNQGQAYPGNDLADVCTWNGWELVYNRANTHSGFIPRSSLGNGAPHSDQDCNSVGRGGGVTANESIYQCPDGVCNQGQAYPGNDVASICYINNGTGTWVWVLNHANGHEGFINLANHTLYWDGSIAPC
ncbi:MULTISPECIES: hypothetical protein [unclassified Streptomyces]|uniref:hypothetical protein n=1 Tax=unclassified Streptomyces TaxID=2593676 RepID=UPI00381F4F94